MAHLTTVGDIYRAALGDGSLSAAQPFAYQVSIAQDGLPELLDVPTGCGKTAAVILGWLYRRRFHPDVAVRESTPRRLVYCAPLRTLTEQTSEFAADAVDALGIGDQVQVHTLMGGRAPSLDWRLNLDKDTILICTMDMALSRALNRGYLASPHAWPIDFAIFNNDVHWVFDEVQLMGPALATSRQLQGLRSVFGVSSQTSTTWMSATLDTERLRTIDAPEIGPTVRLDDFDTDPRLASRLTAPKTLRTRRVDDPGKYAAGMAEIALSEHRPDTLTLVVMNSVELAKDTFRRIRKVADDDVVLLHSRFRPPDRKDALDRALAPLSTGRIVVSTQVVEAGVDMSAATLVTEAAPWSSIIQRAGRCNRWGELESAQLVVVHPDKKSPYAESDLEYSWQKCEELNGVVVSPESLAATEVQESTPTSSVLRRRDLLDLFDTAPDLSGNSIDVSQFIRDGGDLDVAIAWRDIPRTGPDPDQRMPSRDELCRIPITAARDLIKRDRGDIWTSDVASSVWKRVTPGDLRPGVVLVVPTTAGGYDESLGFDPGSRAEVRSLQPDEPPPESPVSDDEASGDDPLSFGFSSSVTLSRHLLDTESAAVALCGQIDALPVEDSTAVIRSARLHDLGKAHEVWQAAVHRAADDDTRVLAKSGGKGRLVYARRGFRHELASALVVLDQPELAGDSDVDLVAYLVASHHGRVRQTMRGTDADAPDMIRGIKNKDMLEPVDLGDDWTTHQATLSLDIAMLGRSEDGSPSWSERVHRLLDEYGPFRLAWLETLVRIADWRASIEEGRPQ